MTPALADLTTERDALKRRIERAEAVLADYKPRILAPMTDHERWGADVIARAAAALRGDGE